MSVIVLAPANFKQLSSIGHYEDINVQGRLGLNFEKIHQCSDFMKFWIFRKKGQFSFKFREIDI